MPGLLIHRNFEIINVCCFVAKFVVFCYMEENINADKTGILFLGHIDSYHSEIV